MIRLLTSLLVGSGDYASIRPDEWREIVTLATRERVLPILGYQIQNKGLDAMDQQARQWLSNSTMSIVRRHIEMRDVLEQIVHRFEVAQIPAVWLKGMALGYMAHPQPALRPMTDHDIWVPLSYINEAYQLLRELGFEERNEHASPYPLLDIQTSFYWNHHIVLGSSDGVIIELHGHLLLEQQTFLGDYEQWFWDQQQTIEIKGRQQIQALSYNANLLYLCAHLYIHHSMPTLLNYLDIHYLITNCEIDWAEIVHMSRVLKWAWFVLSTLEETQAYFKTDIPREVLEALRTIPVPEHLVKVRNAIYEPHTLFRQSLKDIKKIPPDQRWRIFRQLVFPKGSILHKRYPNTLPLLPLQYVSHWYWFLKELARMVSTPHHHG